MLCICAILALPALSVAAEQAQIFLSPRPITGSPLKTLARDANAILSSHLGIAEYEHAPSREEHWTALGMPLEGTKAPWEEEHPDSLIILIEGAGAPLDYLPEALAGQGPTLVIASPPSPDAFDALVSVYLRRIARTFGLHLAEIHGIEAFSHSAASTIEAWGEWAVESLHESWSYLEDLLHLKPDFTTPVETKPEYSRLLSEMSLVDQSGQRLIAELHEMDGYVESLSDRAYAVDDADVNGGYRRRTSVAAMRFSGLHDVEKAHGIASSQYAMASRLFRDVLTAAISAFEMKSGRTGKVVAFVVPPTPRRNPSLTRRSVSDVLEPFSTRPRLVKRASSTPLVPITQQCYTSASSCSNATSNCSGHGSCVQGVIYGSGGSSNGSSSCYVCQCNGTEWTGQTCQKQDYSNQFFLLTGTTIGLIAIVVASVSVLTSIGNDELPATLSAVQGMSASKHE